MNKVSKDKNNDYTVEINFVPCISKKDEEERTRKIISVIVGNSIRLAQDKLKDDKANR